MRLPFLQLESDLLAHGAAGVAALLGCPVPQALGHIALLRAWAVSRGPADSAPDGWVPGDNAARLVAAGAHWTGDPGLFSAALGDPGIGLLEVHRDGIRVTGLEPYADAWDKNTKARERLRKFRERNAYETRTFADGNAYVHGQTQTQTQTQTQKEEREDLPPPSSAAPDGGVEIAPGVWQFTLKPKEPPRRGKKPKPDKPTDPRHAPLTKELCEVHGWPHHGGRTAKAMTELLALADQSPSTAGAEAAWEINRRAALAKASEGFPRVRELHELVTHWGHFAEPQKRGTGPPDGLNAVPPDTCAGCGARGQGGSVGDPEVWLVYECGCLPAFTEAQSKGLHFTKAAAWAAQRRKA